MGSIGPSGLVGDEGEAGPPGIDGNFYHSSHP